MSQTLIVHRIKKAYRKKALELHPDRNYGDVDRATKLFAEVQTAYDVLSDPQERAWYDSHRDVLLRGDTGQGTGAEYSYNIRLTSAKEVLKFMLKFSARIDFSDAPSGFYGGLNDFFTKLADEEALACQWEDLDPVDYPSFGHKDDAYEDVVRPFYAAWNGFATRKTFSWKDEYRLSDASDRRIRRAMEKHNKSLRDDAIREFNDAVRSLIAFVRKRDPRYQENVKGEVERQKILREATAAQAARSRAAHQAKLAKQTVPDWVTSRSAEDALLDEGEESEESEEEHFECVVCNKMFKSEKQFAAHEKSKKHLKLLKQLRRDMHDENENLQSGEEMNGTILSPHLEDETKDDEDHTAEPNLRLNSEREIEGREQNLQMGGDHPTSTTDTPQDSSSDEADDDYTSRDAVLNRLAPEPTDVLPIRSRPAQDSTSGNIPDDVSVSEKVPSPKIGKAKQKRAKKAAQHDFSTQSDSTSFRCVSCQGDFPSKTRLFSHLKEFPNHAKPVGKPPKSGKGKKK